MAVMEDTKYNPEIEDALREKIDAWTSHMPWRSDLEEWKKRRLWQENFQDSKLAEMRQYAGGLAGKRILDLGCGMGGLSVAMAREGAIVTALDPNPDYCEITRLRGKRYGLDITVINSPGETLPFPDSSFDVVTCYDVMEHAEDPESLLREIHRVLVRDGISLVTVTNRWVLKDPHYQLRFVNWMPRHLSDRYVERRGRSKAGSAFEDRQSLSEMHYYTVARFRRLARRIGFDAHDTKEERFFRKLTGGKYSGPHPDITGTVPIFSLAYRAWRFAMTGAFHILLRKAS